MLNTHMQVYVCVCMSTLVPARVISVSPLCPRLMTNSHCDWNNCHKYLNQIRLPLEPLNKAFTLWKALMCIWPLTSCVVMLLGVSLPFTDLLLMLIPIQVEAGALWDTQRERDREEGRTSRRPDPVDNLTCYIIIWGYSISPVSFGS